MKTRSGVMRGAVVFACAALALCLGTGCQQSTPAVVMSEAKTKESAAVADAQATPEAKAQASEAVTGTQVPPEAKAEESAPVTKADEVRKAIKDKTLKRLVTTVDEFKERFGRPKEEKTEQKGPGEEVLFLEYEGFYAAFARDPRTTGPYRIFGFNFGEGWEHLYPGRLVKERESRGEFPPEPIDAAEAVKRLPKIDRKPDTDAWPLGELASIPRYDPTSQSPFQVDLRMADMRNLDLKGAGADLLYATFGTATLWPAKERMPAGFDPTAVMEAGKNPGLGVRSLHARGITGKGVRIAIVDQPLAVDHVEYAGRILLYEETNIANVTPAAMHGAAVASIAVGKTVGVAPEAELFYVAAYGMDVAARRKPGMMNRDFTWKAKAIRRIVDINRNLPDGQKIRAISLSIGWDPRETGYAEMEEAVNAARDSGLLVTSSSIDHTHGVGIHGLGREPMADGDKFESYTAGLWWARQFESGGVSGRLLIPMDSRTTAGPQGDDDYAFYRSGGWSWITPYLAGVYALACQVKPEITPDEFLSLALKTGRTIEVKKADGTTAPLGPIIDPAAIIEALEKSRQR